MNIYAIKGHKVVVTNSTKNNGSDSDYETYKITLEGVRI